MLRPVTPEAIGRVLRALRQRKGWRQADLAQRVRIGQPAVSSVERGDLGAVSVRTLGRLIGETGAELVLSVRWQGGELDRLLDRAHAEIVERVARRLTSLGWDVHVEVSFARYGERGSVDVLGWHPGSRTALIVEVKSEITGVEDTLRRHDVKARLAPHIVFERLGERPAQVGRLLVLPDTSTTRRRLAEHEVTFDRAYPARGRTVSRWLAHPEGALAGVMLIRGFRGGSQRRRRVRRRPGAAANVPEISPG